MASWTTQMETPQVKFEDSPTESFVSTPGGEMASLFSDAPLGEPLDSAALTPKSMVEDQSTPAAATEASDKKPAKKRKSWGQVLPEPKTNLPPRKRAKTEDEKEQRRVERVLRNRRAAQSSRERKRQEVELLEKRNQELESLLAMQQEQNKMLMDQLNDMRRSSGVMPRGSSPLDALTPSPITLSPALFGYQDADDAKHRVMNDFILMPESQAETVNPASLSPELTPVPDSEASKPASKAGTAKPSTKPAASPDVTQHPAAVLCDLQCPSVEVPPSWMTHQTSQPTLVLYLQLQLLLTTCSVMLSAFQRPLTLIAGALKHNLVLQPTPFILRSIIWMVTLPPNYRTSTSLNSSATTLAALLQAQPREMSPRLPTSPNPSSASLTLRIRSLQKLLTSNPILARPLLDATMDLLRLVSEGCDDRVEGLAEGSLGIKGDPRSHGLQMWPGPTSLPSREVLLTLMWAIRVEERNMKASKGVTTTPQPVSSPNRPGSSVLHDKSTILKVVSLKRKGDVEVGENSKRLKFHY